MQDRALYDQILGLASPWSVATVELNTEDQQVDVFLKHTDGVTFPCPECEAALSCYDHVPGRQWRHLDSCQFQTILHAQIPRVNCPEHGVKQVSVPWAEKGSRFTISLRALRHRRAASHADGHRSDEHSGDAVWHQAGDQTWAIVKRAVARGQARKEAQPMPRIGIDEKAFAKGHSDMTLLYDLDNSTALRDQ